MQSTNFMRPRTPLQTVVILEDFKGAAGDKKVLHTPRTAMLPVMVAPLAAPCSRLTGLWYVLQKSLLKSSKLRAC